MDPRVAAVGLPSTNAASDHIVKVAGDPVALLRARALRQPGLGRAQLRDKLLLTRDQRRPTGRDSDPRDPWRPAEVDVRSQQVGDERHLGGEEK